MSEPLHVTVREEARERESFFRDDAEDSELAERQLQIVAVCNTVDDLVMLVNRLRRGLQRASPHDRLPAQALDYLNRNNLQGSPLREGGQ